MIHIHTLSGCAPSPLAHYLKALGVLRIVAEQKDFTARGWWEGESFLLATILDEAELSEFLLCDYSPTPLVSPWNKGSGFYKPNDPGLTPLKKSSANRFGAFRLAIQDVLGILAGIERADSDVRAIKEQSKAKNLSTAARKKLRESDDYKTRLAAAQRSFKDLKAPRWSSMT